MQTIVMTTDTQSITFFGNVTYNLTEKKEYALYSSNRSLSNKFNTLRSEIKMHSYTYNIKNVSEPHKKMIEDFICKHVRFQVKKFSISIEDVGDHYNCTLLDKDLQKMFKKFPPEQWDFNISFKRRA